MVIRSFGGVDVDVVKQNSSKLCIFMSHVLHSSFIASARFVPVALLIGPGTGNESTVGRSHTASSWQSVVQRWSFQELDSLFGILGRLTEARLSG